VKEGIAMYTIGQVSEMFGLPISTLRYYDKEGFFPNLERKGNIRHFSENELEAIHVIECLKQSGLEIKDIKQFFEWVTAGPSSYEKRKELFEMRKLMVKDEIKKLEKSLAMLEFKCWYYDTAIKDGNEDGINAMLPDKLPKEIQKLYDKAHQ
jgi:DNA-binding transcriptional MerR regulator